MIDFDSVEIARNVNDYQADDTAHIYALEHMVSPELCQHLLDYPPEDPEQLGAQKLLEIRRDLRAEPLWKLGVIMFELLHGYSPWDSPERDALNITFYPQQLDPRAREAHRANRDDRRRRIINDPLPVSDQLTQDCVDVLNAMFAKEPRNRPSIEELASFPWFQGSYVDSGADFTRP